MTLARPRLRRFFRRLAAAAALGRAFRGSFAHQFGGPDGGDEFLHAVIIEIDGGAFVVGFGDDAHAVLLVTNGLSFDEYLQCSPPWDDDH